MLKPIFIFLLYILSFPLSAQIEASEAESHFQAGEYMVAISKAEECFESDSMNIKCIRIIADASNKLGDQATLKNIITNLKNWTQQISMLLFNWLLSTSNNNVSQEQSNTIRL